jgi:hypothetical protein
MPGTRLVLRGLHRYLVGKAGALQNRRARNPHLVVLSADDRKKDPLTRLQVGL